MLTLDIPNMTCGHCVRAISQAVTAADSAAHVQADLTKRQVQVETTASRDAVVASLIEAGYPPA